MTTHAVATASSRQPTRTRSIEGRQSFMRAVASEWVKLRTLRSTWVTGVLTIVMTAAIGMPMVIFAAGQHSPNPWVGALYGTTLGQIVVAVLGALVITGEYSSGQIRSTLAAVPHRWRVFLSKALVVAVWSAFLGALSVLISWLAAIPFIPAGQPSFFTSDALSILWGTGLAYAGIAVMALGLGFLLRSTAGSVTIITLLLFVLQIPLSVAAAKWEWVTHALEFLPNVVIMAVADPLGLTSGETGTTVPDALLTHTQAQLVFGAWVVIPALLGWLFFSRRDA